MFDYRAHLIRVIDGDTIVVNLDQGFYSRQEEHIRLLAVDTPEKNDPGFIEATEFTEQWLAGVDNTLRWPLHIFTKSNTRTEPVEERSLVRYLGLVLDIRKNRPSLNDSLKEFMLLHPEWQK